MDRQFCGEKTGITEINNKLITIILQSLWHKVAERLVSAPHSSIKQPPPPSPPFDHELGLMSVWSFAFSPLEMGDISL